MSRCWVVLIALLWCAAALASAQSAPQVSFRIVETDPASRATLDGRQAFYLRIAYESDVPVRFRAKAYREGELTDRGAAYNPAPAYPAGQGEALAWLAFDEAVGIDEIRVTASDEQWRDIATKSHAVDVRWNGVIPRRQHEPAAWAQQLNDAQQEMTSSAQPTAGEGGILADLLITMIGWSIPAYLALQMYLLLRFRGGWRKAAMVPLVGMIPLMLYTLVGLLAGSNLWPLMALFLTPIALVYLIVLWIMRSLTASRTQYVPNP